MKKNQKKAALCLTITMILIIVFTITIKCFFIKEKFKAATINVPVFYSENIKILNQTIEQANEQIKEKEEQSKIVYDNMTLDELSIKLEKSLNSNLKGKGKMFATYSVELGLDPYLALAIVLHETGCSYSCSSLVSTNNNLGGLKGANGKYMSFKTLDEGIKEYLNILYKNYYSKGLTTAELMNPSYAASKTWATKVNWYIEKIKAK